jgi:hypothetical protein
MFFTFSLITFVSLSLGILTSRGVLQPLIGIMFLLVYLGAVVILIGYICAVRPNMVTNPSKVFLLLGLLTPFMSSSVPPLSQTLFTPSSFFLSSSGVSSFILIAVMLFVCLLLVSSQYSSPKGPFRSV